MKKKNKRFLQFLSQGQIYLFNLFYLTTKFLNKLIKKKQIAKQGISYR